MHSPIPGECLDTLARVTLYSPVQDFEQLLEYLSEVGHPVLGMEPFDM